MSNRREVTLKDAPEVLAIIRAAFPSYRKLTAMLITTDTVELHGTYWDGGSRSTYVAVDLATKRSKGAPQYAPPQFGGPQTVPKVALPSGAVIVEGGIFQGKTARAYVYVRADNLQPLLPNG